jgi:hypothetical protein
MKYKNNTSKKKQIRHNGYALQNFQKKMALKKTREK